ncbi:MAG: hypothetical protein V3T05_03690, partial [Myxococcota bacterium]
MRTVVRMLDNTLETGAFLKKRKRLRPPRQGVAAVLQGWRNNPRLWRNVVLERRIDPYPGSFAPMPEDLSPQLRDALERRGVSDLF